MDLCSRGLVGKPWALEQFAELPHFKSASLQSGVLVRSSHHLCPVFSPFHINHLFSTPLWPHALLLCDCGAPPGPLFHPLCLASWPPLLMLHLKGMWT